MSDNDIDERIIRLMKRDGRMSTAALARAISAPEPTVRRRLDKMLQSGALRVVALTDPRPSGLPVAAFIDFKVEREQIETFAEHLATYEHIEVVSVITGPWQITARGRFHTTEDLYDFVLKKISVVPGVLRSRSFVVMKDYKAI